MTPTPDNTSREVTKAYAYYIPKGYFYLAAETWANFRVEQTQNFSRTEIYENDLDVMLAANESKGLSFLLSNNTTNCPYHKPPNSTNSPNRRVIQFILGPGEEKLLIHQTVTSPLTFAFIRLIQCCKMYENKQESRLYLQRPVLLLEEMDRVVFKDTLAPKVDHVREKLYKILFGNMSIAKGVLPFWNTICDWARYLQSDNPEHCLILGLQTYKLAKQYCAHN
ncbi:hypothetical protein PHYBLDRAFT_172535 [Phycomyces blakesleeanus NRRL 1555(-)]|uniref:Uncharacterized protein n=2 Tax=Phycomyces blakesleeanus TaxID=4837 RepID=A0A162NG91_PHYB8|nr:hypothetical protein PHYBLDRAFT_172535 [Phycomyces blakesleeanus NRRL 1555(-)]OAD69284.1 hypothetical protein PHYBLDRAFT_172535 [Phycomyces blakesleeanus NRRL 1555(-)]|eukprot:XP_018287324.1 hypothetical protein PHYBLDRAFT_172535 [Phycomyces blakesleeanus NRRL 1555(-)]